ncbi:MAG TPA: T9SS type A sorting domain-containing protein [Parafilimonas sp.]|nr:T9SS type A sorting domain-containing protein [Parafilimonas sp.]
MKTILTSIGAVTFCFVYTMAVAQSDELDSAFGIKGKATTTIGSSGTPYALTIQSNQRIIAAGSSFNGGDFDFALARYKTNGKLDASFGTGGKVITDLGGDETARSVNLSGGKIIVAGYASSGFCVIRYNLFGKVDSSFGTNGKTITDFNGNGGLCYASAIQTNRKIVAVGTSAGNFVIVRYNANGKIDKTFGVKGILIADSSNGFSNVARAVSLQPDGKIIAVGYSGPFGSRKFLVTRINTNGTLDSTFGRNGKTYTDFSNFFALDNLAFAMAISSTGKIYAGGQSSGNETNNFSQFSLARYRATGKLDKSFSSDGKVLTDFDGFDDGANAIVVMPDGKIIVAGTLYSQQLTGILRFNLDGSPDASFGNNGKLTTNYKPPTAAVLQDDGKYLVAVDDEFTVVRYKAENTPITALRAIAELNEAAVSDEIMLTPNPSKDFVKINNLDPSVISVLSVINASGKIILRATARDKNYSLNIKALPPGIYYLQIVANKKVTGIKFIKE